MERDDIDPNKVAGARLRALRADRGLTQEQLASRAGLSQPAISRLELGAQPWSLDVAVTLALVLGVSSDALVGSLERQVA